MAININYNSKLSYLLSLVTLVVVSFWFFLNDKIIVFKPNGLFDFSQEGYHLPLLLRFVLGVILSFFISSISYLILRENKLFEGDKSVLFLSLSIVVAAFPEILLQTEWLFISILILVSLRILSSVHNQIDIKKEASILGFFNGLLVFFEPSLVLLVIPNLIGMALLRSFQLRESLFFLVSLLLLFFWLFSVFHLVEIDYKIHYKYVFFHEQLNNLTILSLFLPLQAFVIFRAYINSSKMVIRKKNQVKLFLGFLFSITVLSIFLPIQVILTLLVFPLILLFAIFFQGQKKQGLTSIFIFIISLAFIIINLVLD